MNGMKHSNIGFIGFVFGTALLSVLTGCIGYVDAPRRQAVYAQPPPPPPVVYVETQVVQPEYVYYPGYQVYYSRNTQRYVYLEGRSWVSRPAPAVVSVDVLLASPSVTLEFHDHPSVHNAAVVKQYPKHWSAPASNHENHEKHDNKGNGHDKKTN
jgi:hypothetical protein